MTCPGVMLAGAARSYLNRYAVAAGRTRVLATNNDGAWQAAFDLAAAGCDRDGARASGRPSAPRCRSARAARRSAWSRGARDRAGHWAGAASRRALQQRWASRSALACELLCDVRRLVSGRAPAPRIPACKPVYRADDRCLRPGRLWRAGHFGCRRADAACFVADERSPAGARLARRRPRTPEQLADRRRRAGGTGCPRAGGPRLSPRRSSRRGKAFVDFQNDVTTEDVALAHEEGYESVEHLKRYTTLGMGTDQGKTSNINARALMAALRGIETARRRHDDLSAALHAGIDRRAGRAAHRRTLPADAPLAAARLARCDTAP